MLLFIIASILFFGISVFIAERKAPVEYSEKINTISELACQTYENRSIMQWGFKGLGIILLSGIVINTNESLKELYYSIPLTLYALFMILSGVFSTKPFEHLVFYSIKQSKIHALFSQLSGMALALLIVMKLVMVTGSLNRIINIFMLIFVLYTSAQSNREIDNRGVYQRIMYIGCFFWLIYSYSNMMG